MTSNPSRLSSNGAGVAASDFQQAMAAFPGGITALTTLHDGQPIGIIATAVCSLSTEPPSILVCVNKNASVHDAILKSRRFAVNLLSTAHREVVQRFTSRHGAERFAPDQWETLETGAPILVEAALVLDCELLDTHDGYSHTIVVGAVKATQLARAPDTGCLLWHARGYARSEPMTV